MSFKRRLLALLAMVLLSGCSLYEGPPAARKMDFSQGNLGCLKDLSAKLVLYFDGKANSTDVNRIADCSIHALRAFGDLTRGENRDRFTAQEVRNFLQRYFLDDATFSDSLLREIMRVKQALVGGRDTDFTREDLQETEGLINDFRDIFLRFQPFMPLSMERVRTERVEYVENAARAIKDAGDILGRRIAEKNATYSFEEMGRLFDEIIRAFPASASALRRARVNLKTASFLKEMLISPQSPRGTVTAEEWRLIFEDGSQWLGVFLKLENLKGQYSDWTRGEGRSRLFAVVGESIDLLDRVVARYCPKGDSTQNGGCTVPPGIPFKSIRSAMDRLDWDGSVGGMKFQKSTLKKIMKPLFRRFFGGTDLGQTGRSATRLTAKHLERVRALIREWVDGSRYVEGIYSQLLQTPNFPDNAMAETKDIIGLDVREVLRANGGVTDEAVEVASALRDGFSRTVALMDQDSRGAIFDGKNRTRGRVYRELVRYTWLRPFLKQVLLGYMKGPNIAAREKAIDTDGLTLEEFTDFISDYWQVLVDFKMVGEKNTKEGDAKNRFREASLFTQVSNGDSLISIDEGVQLILYMLSSNPLGHQVHDRAKKLCDNGPIDDYGKPSIEPNCYREKIFDFRTANLEGTDLWTPFPIMLQFYGNLSETQMLEFQKSVERAVRKSGMKPEDYFTSGTSNTVAMIFHYIEGLFLRFDENGDGFIDNGEAAVAFPIFRDVLAERAKMDPNDPKLPSVFTYLLAKGNPPGGANMGGWQRFWKGVDFVWWHVTKPKFKADRLNLLAVFATLSGSAPTPNSPPEKSSQTSAP